jgi:hypothetical protein
MLERLPERPPLILSRHDDVRQETQLPFFCRTEFIRDYTILTLRPLDPIRINVGRERICCVL